MKVPDENFGPDADSTEPRAPILGQNGQPNVDTGADLPVQSDSGSSASTEPENDSFPVDRPKLQDLHQQFQESDADRNAKVIQISQATGKPPGFVDQHLDSAQKAMNTPRSSFFQTIEDHYPGTTKFLSNPANMAVSKDDMPNLALHERILRDLGETWSAEKTAFTAGALEEELGFTRYQQLSGEPAGGGDIYRLGSSVAARAGITEADPEKRAQLLSQKLEELSSQMPQEQNKFQKGLYGFTRFAPQIIGGAAYGAKYGIPAAGAAGLLGIETGPGEVGIIPTAFSAGAMAGGLDYGFKFMTGLQYDQLKKTKLADGTLMPDNVAKVAAVATGAAAAGLSLVKLGAVLETIPGGKEFLTRFSQSAGEKVLQNSATYRQALSNFAKNYVNSVAHFTGAMVGIEAVNKIGTEAAKTAAGDTTVTQSPEQMLGDFGRTIEDAALTGGVGAAPGTVIGAGWELSRARQAENTKQALLALGEASKDSKTLKRMPEAFQQFVKEVTKDGPVQDVHVPVEAFQTYFQGKNIDPSQVADELGVIKAYQEAVQTGGDVKIPLETWAQKIGPTEHLAGLADDVRFRPDEMTVREKQQAEAEAKEAFAKLAGDQEKAGQVVQQSESAQRIQSEIHDQLKAAGLTPAEVRVNPQLHAAFFKTLGDKLGVDPYELYRKYPLTIEKTDKAISAPEEHVLEQAKHIEGTNVVDAFSEFRKRSAEAGVEPPQPKAKSAIAKVVSRVRGSLGHKGLDSIEARYPKGKRRTEIRKGLKEAQQPDAGPYVTDKRSDFTWFPNYEAKPTGVIGPDRISQPHDTLRSGAEVDPLGWAERKYGATHELIRKHSEAEIPLTINTSSDLVATQEYVDALPPGTRVRMHLLTKSEHLNRILFPGNSSRARQMAAVDALRENGVHVEEIRPTVDGVISSAGGIEKAMAATGETEQSLREFIAKNIGLHAVPDGKTYEQAGPKGGARFDHLSESVPVIRLSPSAEARSAEGNPKELGKIAVEAARSKRGEPIVNKETSESILLSGESLNKELKRTHDVATATALEHIDTLLAEAHYGGEHETLKSNDSASDYRYYYAPIEVDGKAYNAKITVRVDQQPVRGGGSRDHLVYDALSVNEVRRPEGANGVLNPNEGATASGYNEPPAISKAQFVDEYHQVRQALGGHYQGGEDQPRGQIRFATQGSEKIFNIDLLKKADKSTFLHETGHYFLEVFGDIAKGESAPQDVKDDYAALLNWLGVEKPEDIGVEHHEKFARGFEAYLREGKAPSLALKGAFNRFRDWLVKLYKDVKGLRVELSPEVRGIMDRMLATHEEIEQAQRSIGYQPEEIPGISKEAAENIRSLQDQARDVAENALVKEQMKEMTEKHQEFLAKQRERITENAKEEVEQEPLFAAMKELHEGPGNSAAARARRFLKASEKGEGVDAQFETLAEIHGFKNGEDLAQQIVQAAEEGAFDKAVKEKVQAGMSQFADMRSTDMIRQEALRQVHNEKMTELLAMEREAIVKLLDQRAAGRKNRQAAAIEAKAARMQAKLMLEAKPIKEAGDSGQYLVAERKAAQRVTKALAEKDFEAAAKAKREQMLSHALAGQAMKNAQEIDKILGSLVRYQRRKNDLLNMPYGFVRQIDDMLFRSGLGEKRVESAETFLAIANDMAAKGEDPADIANATGLIRNAQGQWTQEGLTDLVNRINENYYGLILPDSITSGGVRPYESMSLMDLREMRTAIQTLAAIGTKHDRFLSAFEGVDIKKAALEFSASVAKNFGTPRAKELLPGSPYATKTGELLAKLQDVPSRLERVLDTMLTICHKFDGLEEGPAKKYIYRLMAEAENRRLEKTRFKMEEVEKIFSDHYTPEEFAKYKEKGSGIELAGQHFTRENILAMALNWGNEGNKQRLLDGFQFSEETVRRAFSRLDKKDWDFVQATWDHIHKYWPEIVKLEMDVNGVEPQGVDPVPFQNEHGDYRGGYYPIAYDFTKSVEAHQNNLQRDALFKQYSTVVASTAQGHAQARVSWVKRPVRLSLDVLAQHHEDVIHDLEYRRAVIDVRRFLSNRDVKQAIALAVGTEGYSAINKWLVAVAGGGSEPLTAGDKLARWLRFRATFFQLAFRIVSAPKIAVENVVNLSSELGMSGAARAIKDYYLGESGLHEKIIGKSEFMNQRTKHLDRDMGDLYDKWQGDQSVTPAGNGLDKVSPGLGAKVESFAFFVHAYLDQSISFPLWADAYKQALAAHGDETLAIHQADEAVKRTFMTGSRIDMPQIMRGSEKQKLATTAYGYSNMMWNRFSMQRFEAKQAWIQGDRLAASALMARSYLYTFAVPALTAALTRAWMRNSQSDASDDEKEKRFVATMLEEGTPLKFIPVLRDVAPYLIKKSMGEHAENVSFTPMEGAVQTLLDPFGEFGASVFQGRPLPDKWPEHLANSVSLMTGVPKEMNDVMFNFIDWQGGAGEPTWRDVFSRRTKK